MRLCYITCMPNTVRDVLREYLRTIDEPEVEYVGEVITQVNIRCAERMTAAIDALAERLKMSRSGTAKFILEPALYEALDELGMQVGFDVDDEGKPVARVMTHQEQLEVIARVRKERAS
jgi:hypothetical protein